jgi:ubiquinone/menaquinone biosynthesis C-methylase UbiE
MNIPAALREFHRVLIPGGRVWLTLHPLSMLDWRSFLHARTAVYAIYRLVNTASLAVCNRQFRFPLRRSRMESFQTAGGIRRCLDKSGFANIAIRQTPQQFLVTGERR